MAIGFGAGAIRVRGAGARRAIVTCGASARQFGIAGHHLRSMNPAPFAGLVALRLRTVFAALKGTRRR